MNNGLSNTNALGPLLSHIQIVAMMHPCPAAFIRELQDELEAFTGANVSFSSRNTDWLSRYGFLADREEMSADERQNALRAAAAEHRKKGDIDEQLDSVSASMFDYLDAHHPCKTTA